MDIQNLCRSLPDAAAAEAFTQLPTQSRLLRIERIVSQGQATPPEQWYDQDWHEWVLLLAGSAGLRFADKPRIHILKPGDYVDIPAHCRHRVEWTHPHEATVWLAVHYAPEDE